tara:strand:+ start:269 stop:571 length:303 start_codon:yes stop_codon:yes gene_type:complete
MYDGDTGIVDYLPATFSCPPTQVCVLPIKEKPLIKPSYLCQCPAAYYHAGSGYPIYRLRCIQPGTQSRNITPGKRVAGKVMRKNAATAKECSKQPRKTPC